MPLSHCLAKSRSVDGVSLPGRTVEEHCRIVGAVAAELLQRMPDILRRFFPKGSSLAVSLHDVGKVFPYFQSMIYGAVGYDLDELKSLVPVLAGKVPHHSEVSWAALEAVHGRKSALAEVAGWHHGRRPDTAFAVYSEIYGGPEWQLRRVELIERLRDGQDWPEISSGEELVMLKGLTVVADWIGSGPLFDDPDEAWEPLVSKAVDEAGFKPFTVESGKSFRDIFGFSPNAMQEAMARAVTDPGVYVLEAPMGMGKTEAALFAAYRMLEEGKAGGLYFALPTQLTSNKIYERLRPFLEAILSPGSRHFVDPLLLHSMAWLYASHNEEGPHAGSWFEQSKRGLLAPFGAGTLDQALMSVINVRHPAIRSFGLAGKVVILDEVHSYDAYTGTLLETLVKHLRSLGCTVIILSATLTKSRLTEILEREGLAGEAYPLITAAKESGTSELGVDRAGFDVEVLLKIRGDEADALEEALLRAEQGQQVLWIENTVKEAQALFRKLSARASGMDIEVGLLHSRFTASDRQRNESRWTGLYGKASTERGLCGRILIGTQVLEQSLDIDADFLITRLCPTDMLFQRMGRLWRHEGTARPAGARRECWVLSPSLEEACEQSRVFGASGGVYSPYVLARTLEVWEGRTSVRIPGDIRPLLEATYAERSSEAEPSPLVLRQKMELQKRRSDMKKLALSSRSEGQTLPDAAATRFIEEELSPLLIVRELGKGACVLADGQRFRFDEAGASSVRRREITAMLFSNIVRVRSKDMELAVPINKSAEKRRLFERWLPVRENYEGIFLARLNQDGSLGDLCSAGSAAGYYADDTGWEKERYTS